jgi:hypothetical protein
VPGTDPAHPPRAPSVICATADRMRPDLPRAMAAMVAAVSDGTLTPEEAAAISAVLEAQRRAVETAQLEQRIAALEAAHGERV